MIFDENDILRQWDMDAESFEFPMLDNGYFFHCDQKLTIFRDDERWAMTIEVFAYFNRQQGIECLSTHAYVCGNCLLSFNNNDNFFCFAEDNGVETFIWDEDDGGPWLNIGAKSILVKNKELKIVTDLKEYIAKGIVENLPERLAPWEVMRAWVPEKSHLFWINREEFSNKIPLDLPVLMVLSNWHHPDLIESEPPSNTDTFRQLAKVIATGDISFYKDDPEEHNTHWSNWPEGGLC